MSNHLRLGLRDSQPRCWQRLGLVVVAGFLSRNRAISPEALLHVVVIMDKNQMVSQGLSPCSACSEVEHPGGGVLLATALATVGDEPTPSGSDWERSGLRLGLDGALKFLASEAVGLLNS